MPDFKTIIKAHTDITHFAGTDPSSQESNKRRASLISALSIREKECQLRFRIATSLLILALLVLLYLSIFTNDAFKTFKELMSVIGGGSIVAILFYILSIRDELTKIKQTKIIANEVDEASLNAMLLTLSSK